MKILKNLMVVLVALVLVAGCKKKNPLIGDWTIDLNSLDDSTRMQVENTSMNRTITFTKDKMIMTDQALLVSYELHDNLVKVRPSGDLAPLVIVLRNDGAIEFPTPHAGTVVYRPAKK